jgi:hypothetical protein
VGDNGTILKTTTGGISPVTTISTEVPEQFELEQNYPNPFNPVTNIGFQIMDLSPVFLEIHDAAGKKITTLINESLSAGTYEAAWDASGYPSGVYFYTLKAGKFTQTKKLILLK